MAPQGQPYMVQQQGGPMGVDPRQQQQQPQQMPQQMPPGPGLMGQGPMGPPGGDMMGGPGGMPMQQQQQQQGPPQGMAPAGPGGMGPAAREEPVHVPDNATHSLYFDKLPSDVTKRELAHIFRPFTGFQVRTEGLLPRTRAPIDARCAPPLPCLPTAPFLGSSSSPIHPFH